MLNIGKMNTMNIIALINIELRTKSIHNYAVLNSKDILYDMMLLTNNKSAIPGSSCQTEPKQIFQKSEAGLRIFYTYAP